ncbi:uncharacterized protein [Palaemon carinicauda]|uniref:uncharacterized protein isoform X1 n=1 Tax=Palaemon carinicauda TaxID=392227 RepID=UPI0035B65C13
MRVLVMTLSLVTLVSGHPVHDHDHEPNIYRSIEANGKEVKLHADEPSAHDIQRRDVENDAHSINKREAEPAVNSEDDEQQVAYSREGAVAIQGNNGQYVYASDKGGPIVQIQQDVFKSSCCNQGSGCACNETGTTTAGP